VNALSNKEKLLASAQKLLLKGRVDKAIKDYEQIVKLDQNDIRHRLKLAELYNRCNDTAKAVGEYEIIAKHYQKNKFHLKAIAVLKQLQKLQPERKELHCQLGELNEQQGLIGNAIAEYRTACDYYEKEDKTPELLGVLKKIAELAPQNVPVRMKLIDISFQQGAAKEAQAEFDRLLEALREQQLEAAALIPFYEHYLALFPDSSDATISLDEARIRCGQAEKGVKSLERLADGDPRNCRLLRALAEGYSLLGNRSGKKKALSALLSLEPEDMELRRDFIALCLELKDAKQALDTLAPWKEKFLKADMGTTIRDFYQKLKALLPGDPRVKEGVKYLDEFFQKRENPFGSMALNESGLPDVGSLSGINGAEPVLTAEKPVSEAPAEVLTEHKKKEKPPRKEEKSAAPPAALAISDEDLASEDFRPISASEEIAPEGPPEEDKQESFLDINFLSELEEEDAEAAPPDFSKELEESDFYLQQGLLDEAERICREILTVQSDCAEALDRLDQIGNRRAALAAEKKKKAAAAKQKGANDLDASLEALADSQRGVKTEISQEDTETHYQLGIAFKEMGQLDEAIREFDQAIRDPDRFVACVVLKASCLAEKGAFDAAEDYFLGMLSKSGISEQNKAIMNFELGLFYQQQNRLAEALERFRLVSELNPSYRDVGEKISELQTQIESGDLSVPESLSIR
jgi:tetratricopeptide (TPR) repeat protein